MNGTLIDNIAYDSEDMKFYLQEKFILEVTELISELMEEKGIRKTDLAMKLGRSKGYVTQLLDGRANMTLRTISDVMWALKSEMFVTSKPLRYRTQIRYFPYSSEEPSYFWGFPKIERCPIEIKHKNDLKREFKAVG